MSPVMAGFKTGIGIDKEADGAGGLLLGRCDGDGNRPRGIRDFVYRQGD